MADKRKLQSDIDRNLKRVQEGRVAFQDILDKYEASTNQAQKEKFEADLKKEIKKLQRLRDQIKTWLTSNEIKDKRGLVEARRFIELDMERFKVIEKETKTKAYSKEGLSSADSKKDPLAKEKEELDEWLKTSIAVFKSHVERYEFDIVSLSSTTKKKRIDKDKAQALEEKKRRLEICLFHIEKLETCMRHFDNERIEVEQLKNVRDDVEHVIDTLESTNIIDMHGIYDDLQLDELGDGAVVVAGPSTLSVLQDSEMVACGNPSRSALPDSSDFSMDTPSSTKSLEEPKFDLVSGSTSTPVKCDKATGSTSKSKGAKDPANQTAPPGLISSGPAAPAPPASATKAKDQSTSQSNPSATSTKSVEKVASAASVQSTKGTPSLNDALKAGVVRNLSKMESSVPPVAERQSQSPQLTEPTAPPKWTEITNPLGELTAVSPGQGQSSVSSAFSMGPTLSPMPGAATPSASSVQTLSAAASTLSVNGGALCAVAKPGPALSMIHPKDAAAPFRNSSFDRMRANELPDELQMQLTGLESAHQRLPNPCDTEKSRRIICKNMFTVPSYYPREPLRQSDTEDYFMKLDTQTLFFIFYYFEGTRAQYLAAKSLKRMSWRFHTKLMMWFQRLEEPKEITDEYESGTYIYYDYKLMTQMKREEFVFQYNFLEDKEL